MFSTCMNTGRVFCHASLSPLGGSGSLRKASSRPTSRSARDPLRRAEQVAQHRHRVSGRLLEQQRGTGRFQHPVTDLRHLQSGIDGDRNALQRPPAFELVDEVAQVGVFHGEGRYVVR
jgi:hypothetical protein